MPESYDKDEVIEAFEEAQELELDASNVTIHDFELLKVIGKGGYSQVVMARKKDSGFLYAIKIMDKEHLLSCMTPSAIVRECTINRKLKKSNFVIDLYWAFQNSKRFLLTCRDKTFPGHGLVCGRPTLLLLEPAGQAH